MTLTKGGVIVSSIFAVVVVVVAVGRCEVVIIDRFLLRAGGCLQRWREKRIHQRLTISTIVVEHVHVSLIIKERHRSEGER